MLLDLVLSTHLYTAMKEIIFVTMIAFQSNPDPVSYFYKWACSVLAVPEATRCHQCNPLHF